MSGKISTIVGNGFIGFSGDGQAATLAHINNPGKVEVSSNNDIYFAVSSLCSVSNTLISKGH